MTEHATQDIIAERAAIVAAPRPNRVEHAFDLHPILFAATIGCYFAFLAVMGAAFMNAELVLPFAISAVYIAMAFAVPGLWARLRPKSDAPVPGWSDFLREGIQTGSGRLTAGAAITQVLTVPLLIVVWALGIACIKASI